MTSPAGSTGLNRAYQIKLTFADPLIDLLDGSISSDPLKIQDTPYPTAAGDPISGECENPSGTGTSFCRVDTRRFLSSGVAAIPEPSTWALMLIGFAGLGFAGYRKRRARFAALRPAPETVQIKRKTEGLIAVGQPTSRSRKRACSSAEFMTSREETGTALRGARFRL